MVERFGFCVPEFGLKNAKFFSAAARYASSPSTAYARASAPSIRPFHDASTLSSRCGRTRLERAANIFFFADFEQRLLGWDEIRIHDAQHVLIRQRIGIAVIHEVALFRHAENFIATLNSSGVSSCVNSSRVQQ